MEIIDNEEYVDKKTASELMKIKIHNSEILVKKNLIYTKLKGKLWISIKSINNVISYENEMNIIKESYSNIIQELEKERYNYYSALRNVNHKYYPELYLTAQKNNLTKIPNSEYLYNPILYKRIDTLHLSPLLKVFLKNIKYPVL